MSFCCKTPFRDFASANLACNRKLKSRHKRRGPKKEPVWCSICNAWHRKNKENWVKC